MDYRKCIYCIQSKRELLEVICSNEKLLRRLGKTDPYECIKEPCYCVFYKTYKDKIKEILDND